MSWTTELDQLQTDKDTSVTSNRTTNSSFARTDPDLPWCICVSPLGHFLRRHSWQHSTCLTNWNGTVVNASEKSKRCHAHEMALQKNASARASPNVNEALPSLKQRTQNYECIHMRYRSSTDSALCWGKRLDHPVHRDFIGRWQMAQWKNIYFGVAHPKFGSCSAKSTDSRRKENVVKHRNGQTADTTSVKHQFQQNNLLEPSVTSLHGCGCYRWEAFCASLTTTFNIDHEMKRTRGKCCWWEIWALQTTAKANSHVNVSVALTSLAAARRIMCASVCDTDLQRIRYLCHSQRPEFPVNTHLVKRRQMTQRNVAPRFTHRHLLNPAMCSHFSFTLSRTVFGTQIWHVGTAPCACIWCVCTPTIGARGRALQTSTIQRTETNTRHNTVPRLNTSIIDARRHTELHVVLAYCRQHCTTNKLTTKTKLLVPWPENNAMKYLDRHMQERSKTTLARTKNSLHLTTIFTQTNIWNAPDFPKCCLKNSACCVDKETTHRNNICRVILFQPCSWHLQKRRSKDCPEPTWNRTTIDDNISSPNFLSSCQWSCSVPPEFVQDICSYTLGHVEFFRVSCCSFQSSANPSTVVHLQPATFWHTSFLKPSAHQEVSVPHPGGKAWWLSSNPRGSVLELVESLRDHRDESGAISSSCSDNSAVQIRRWKSVWQTLRSRHVSQQRTKRQREIIWRDWHNWKKKQHRRKPHGNWKTHFWLKTNSWRWAQPKVSMRETRDWNESLILEAYDAAGSKQLPQNLKRIQDSGGEASLLAQLNEKEKQLRANR